jgi:thiamine-phosphate pyrophosphorylase
MRGLYAIVDLDTLTERGLDPLRFAEAVLSSGPAALQLRAKHATPEATLQLLRALAPSCQAARVPLVGNDLVDVALLGGCDMVHVGQEDLSLSMARRIAPKLGVGVSTHTPEQLSLTLAERPTYVAFGPVYRTYSKEQPDPEVGLSGLRQAAKIVGVFAREQGERIPLVAIGGISLDRAEGVAAHADMIAVIRGLLPERGVAGDTYALVQERCLAYVEAIARGSAQARVAS